MSNKDLINIIEKNKSNNNTNNSNDSYKDDFYDYAKINNLTNIKKHIDKDYLCKK